MNKVNLILLVFALVGAIALNAQKSENKAFRDAVQKYADDEIVPGMIVQQNQFMLVLTEDEKQQLISIRDEISQRKKTHQEKSGNGHGTGKGGKHKSQLSDEQRQQMQNQKKEIHSQVAAIANAHPDAVKDYQRYIDEHKVKWLADIEKLKEESGFKAPENRQGRGGAQPIMIDRLSDPVMLLMWNQNEPFLKGRPHQKKKGSGGQKG